MKLVVCLAVLSTLAIGAEEFEVASVKLAQPGKQGVWSTGDRVRMLNLTLHELIATAYDVKDYQVSGPPWISADRFDIIAKISPDVAKLAWNQEFEHVRAMTQTLLADRFKLELHRDSKELPVYALVPAKGGAKLRELGPNPGDMVKTHRSAGHLAAQQMPMVQLIEILNDILKRPILDETGIKGIFDITLDWAPDVDTPGAAADTRPSLFTAIQEQLGLKLESRRSSIPVLVVDRAEKPSE
jgi:uncharacterized protein (TIGR03435 family)